MRTGWRGRLFWAAYSRVYDQLWDNSHLDAVCAHIDAVLPRDVELLEIGAGTGLVSERLTRGGHRVRVCEPTPAMAQRLTRRLPEVPLVSEPLQELPSMSAQHVVAVNVLHLLDDPADGVAHLMRICRPEGLVVIVSGELRAGLVAAAAAQRRAGVSAWAVARFVAWHLLLGPLTVLCGMSASTRRDPIDVAQRAGAAIHQIDAIYRMAVLSPLPPILPERGV